MQEIFQTYIAEIQWTKRAVLENMLPSIPDPAVEAKRAEDEAWRTAMSRPSDGSDDPADYADWAVDQGMDVYSRLTAVRQGAANMSAVMLWHLLEQQMLSFHLTHILSSSEEREVRRDAKKRNRLLCLCEFHKRLEKVGYSMKKLDPWAKIDELRLVANAVKHGPGKSLDELVDIRPDLLIVPGMEDFQFGGPKASYVEKPAGGEDLYVRDSDLETYFESAILLWKEFGGLVEKKALE